jgi:hypothetical protein
VVICGDWPQTPANTGDLGSRYPFRKIRQKEAPLKGESSFDSFGHCAFIFSILFTVHQAGTIEVHLGNHVPKIDKSSGPNFSGPGEQLFPAAKRSRNFFNT